MLLCYDLSDPQTFSFAGRWLRSVRASQMSLLRGCVYQSYLDGTIRQLISLVSNSYCLL